jgi:hypothetical protein
MRTLVVSHGRVSGDGPRPCTEIFDPSTIAELGHAPDWIDAGAAYEELLKELENEPADVIICRDPWSAQLLSRAGEASTSARWIFESDVDEREHAEYWRDMEPWFRSLPWSEIKAIEAPPEHLQKPGAWEWRSISPLTSGVVLLVRYSGSFPHLKAFVDALARQHYPKERMSCLILAKERSADLDRYLRWLALAHPKMRVSVVQDAAGAERPWEARLNRTLAEWTNATVVLVDDHAVLPEHFARDLAAEEASVAFSSLPLSPEVTAHVLTGNLDPLATYDKLAGGFGDEPTPENARAIPAEVWRSGEGAPSARILRLAAEPTGDAPRRSLLQLADLP